MKKRNVIVLIVGGVLILAGIGYWIFRSQNNTNSTRYITGQATKGTLTVSVSGTGNVIVGTSAKISPTISGTVQDLAVAQGDHVTKGEKLFLIQNDQLDTTVQKSYVSYLQSKQALTNAQAAVTNAQTNYNNVVKDSGQTKAQSALDQAELQLSTDQATLAKYQADNLATSGTHSDSDIALLEQKISLDQSNVDAAQVALDQSNASAGANILVAQKQLSAAEQGATIAQKNVENALADYNTQKTNAALRTVTAPIDGTLTTLSVSNGDTIGNASTGSSSSSANSSTSSSTSASSTIAVIQDLTTLKASVAVNEVDASSVKPGQKVSMTFDAIDGLTLTGKVEKIDTAGTTTSGVVSYSALIDFDTLDPRVLPAMSISATITTKIKQDVLMVPSSAVKTQNSNPYVEILQDGASVQQSVTIGDASDTETEITDGLNEGDSIITQTISGGSASATQSHGLFNFGAPGGTTRGTAGNSGAPRVGN